VIDFLFEASAIGLVAILGASIGSFLNVVIYRLPAGLSLSYPPSRCPHCLTPLRKRENVPILGWFMLKGKCAHCSAPISFRYPLVETMVMVLFLATYLFFGFSLQTIGYWVFISYLLSLALIDLDTLTLSNRLMKSGLVLGLAFQTAIAAGSGSIAATLWGFLWAVFGAVFGLWLLDIVTWIGRLVFGPNAMGGGDAKLFAMIGAWLGWKLMLMSGFLACLAGTIFGVSAIALKIIKRENPMPFGPFLALGAILAMFYGEFLVSGYWMLMGKLYGN
jgi:leader peptidase (prepilin peptidase) / N-methyltransferase